MVWGVSDLEITGPIQLVATTHAGGVLLVAEDPPGTVVGFAYAFPGLRDGVPHLHSDMLAVHPDARGRGFGRRLKWAQRDEALRRGIRLVTWTFDPLQAGNARLNLRHLGATAGELLPDLYGATSSGLHHDLPTDRLGVRWELTSPSVRQRAGRKAPPPGRRAPRRAPGQRRRGGRRAAGLRPAPDGPRGAHRAPRDPRRLGRAVPRRSRRRSASGRNR